jgi:hypothetical protein
LPVFRPCEHRLSRFGAPFNAPVGLSFPCSRERCAGAPTRKSLWGGIWGDLLFFGLLEPLVDVSAPSFTLDEHGAEGLRDHYVPLFLRVVARDEHALLAGLQKRIAFDAHLAAFLLVVPAGLAYRDLALSVPLHVLQHLDGDLGSRHNSLTRAGEWRPLRVGLLAHLPPKTLVAKPTNSPGSVASNA